MTRRSAGQCCISCRRRGALYIAVLGTSMLVSVIGFSALLAVRAQRRAATGELDVATARLNAQTAIDLGLLEIQSDSAWRSKRSNGLWLTGVALADGTCSLHVIDPVDGDLADSNAESVVMTGVGAVRDSLYALEARYDAVSDPLDALKTCLHTAGNIYVESSKQITVSGGPLSSNGNVSLDGNVIGNVEAASVDRPARVVGTVTAPAPVKPLPAAGTFDAYAALATTIPAVGQIQNQVISRASNPWGKTNGDGVYYMDTGGSDLEIRGTRLLGTLVIKCNGKKVKISEQVLLEPYRPDYPVLVIDGNLELLNHSATAQLGELLRLTNFNPTGTPYGGDADSDQLDVYPNEVRGLIYVTGTVRFENTAKVAGVVVCNGDVTIGGTNTIIYDDQPYLTPPPGFTQTGRLVLTDGSFRRVLSPPN